MAAHAIHEEVQNVRRSGKPVFVSMGDYGSSGGYLIAGACCAHHTPHLHFL